MSTTRIYTQVTREEYKQLQKEYEKDLTIKEENGILYTVEKIRGNLTTIPILGLDTENRLFHFMNWRDYIANDGVEDGQPKILCTITDDVVKEEKYDRNFF